MRALAWRVLVRTPSRSSSVSVTIPAVTQASSGPASTAGFTQPAGHGNAARKPLGEACWVILPVDMTDMITMVMLAQGGVPK